MLRIPIYMKERWNIFAHNSEEISLFVGITNCSFKGKPCVQRRRLVARRLPSCRAKGSY